MLLTLFESKLASFYLEDESSTLALLFCILTGEKEFAFDITKFLSIVGGLKGYYFGLMDLIKLSLSL